MTATTTTTNHYLTLLAWLNVILHVVGLVLVVIGMRPGTPLIPLQERMAYLATSPSGWKLGWGIWILCALCLVAFCASLAGELRDRAVPASLAVTLAAAGAAIDIFCDSILITVLPMVASWGENSVQLFLTIERITGVGGLIVANGFYTLAILILTLCMRKRGSMLSTWLGYGVFFFGMLMVAAGFTGVPRHLELATGPTILLFCGWTVSVARDFQPQRHEVE